MRERRKSFRVEWNSAAKIYDLDGRFARPCVVSNFSNGGAKIASFGTQHSSGRVPSAHFTSRPRPEMSRHTAFKGRFGGGI